MYINAILMNIPIDVDFGKLIQEKLEDAYRKRGHANIIVAGKTGVGKSTLINAVFQGDIASTGQGKPVTQDTREYTKEGVPISIFDTRGLELKAFDETLRQLTLFIDQRAQEKDPSRHIHCAWLCISEESDRFEDGEINLAKQIAMMGVPVIGVITKSEKEDDGGFGSKLLTAIPELRNTVRVMAKPKVVRGGHSVPVMGLHELVDLTMEVIPDGQRNAFAAAQKVVLRQKKGRAHKVVIGATAAAATIGGAPIPFSDAVGLVPVQVSMLAGVAAVFGLPFDTGFFSTMIAGIIGGGGGILLGRAIVGGLVLLIPGAGMFLKGVICGSTAAALTACVGEAFIAAISSLIEADPINPPTAEQVAEAMKTEMAKRNPFKK